MTRYPDARRIPGLVLFRWDAPLFFANAELFKRARPRCGGGIADAGALVVVAAEPVTSVDVTAATPWPSWTTRCRRWASSCRFAELKDPVKDKLKRFGLFAQFGPDHFYPTLGAAVSQYLKQYEVGWEDWEDRAEETK